MPLLSAKKAKDHSTFANNRTAFGVRNFSNIPAIKARTPFQDTAALKRRVGLNERSYLDEAINKLLVIRIFDILIANKLHDKLFV